MIIYREEDFFEEHIDAPHSENMIFTLSVELYVDCETEGGDLVVGGYRLYHANKDNIRLALFYHDVPHFVKQIENGYRVSLIFDVVQSSDNILHQIASPHATSFKHGLKKLRDKGFNKIAIKSEHNYVCKSSINGNQLKGTDRLFYELAKKNGARNIDIVSIYDDDGNIYREEILNVIHLNHAFSNVYVNREDDYDEDEESDEEDLLSEQSDEEDTNDKKLTKFSDVDKIKPSYDKKNQYIAIKDEYLLGDTIFLKTNSKEKVSYTGDEEIHLGNEGFYGTIYSNLAIIAQF